MNEVQCYFGEWMYSIRLGTFDVSVSAFAGIFFGLNILFLVAHQQLASSEAAHLLGGVCGLALGAVLLVTGRVDCEGWDLFSIWRGETHESRTQQAAEMFDARREEDRQRKLEQAPRLIVFLIEQGNFRKAYETYINTEATCGPVTLDSRNHLVLVKYLLKIRNQAAAITLLEQLVERDPRQKRARLLLAELLLKHQQRPTKAMLLLADETINYPPELESVRQQLLTRARQMQEEGVLELRE